MWWFHSLHEYNIPSFLCNVFSDFRPDAARQIRCLLCRGIGFGLDVPLPLWLSFTLIISFLAPLMSISVSLFFSHLSHPLSSHFILSHQVVSHFCSRQAWCEDNHFHNNLSISSLKRSYQEQ